MKQAGRGSERPDYGSGGGKAHAWNHQIERIARGYGIRNVLRGPGAPKLDGDFSIGGSGIVNVNMDFLVRVGRRRLHGVNRGAGTSGSIDLDRQTICGTAEKLP